MADKPEVNGSSLKTEPFENVQYFLMTRDESLDCIEHEEAPTNPEQQEQEQSDMSVDGAS